MFTQDVSATELDIYLYHFILSILAVLIGQFEVLLHSGLGHRLHDRIQHIGVIADLAHGIRVLGNQASDHAILFLGIHRVGRFNIHICELFC